MSLLHGLVTVEHLKAALIEEARDQRRRILATAKGRQLTEDEQVELRFLDDQIGEADAMNRRSKGAAK